MNAIPRKLGRYLITREVGRGAMGVVYKAHDPVIEREVAIKAIHLNFEVTDDEKTTYLSRFYREAKAAGQLNHPGIVTIYDVDEDKEAGVPFIVMEFLEGTTLQEIISNGVVLPAEEVNGIMTQVADALSYAHEHGIVHRDVKSANILITQGMKTKITDFGIARLPSSDLTKSGQFIGTPNYMSPEQIEGKIQVDGRSDLFSLGVIFYMLLTGERPFTGDSFNTVAYRIVNIDPLPPTALNPNIPEEYNGILGHLLAKDPAHRYMSGRELIADLRRARGLAPEAPPELQLPKIPSVESIPPLSDAADKPLNEREKIAGSQTITLFRKPEVRRMAFIALIALLLASIGGGFYFYKGSESTTPPPTVVVRTPQIIPAKPTVSNDNLVRSKWALAMNYYQNGLYDKSLEQLHAILAIDPSNQEARKYMELIAGQKEAASTVQSQPAVQATKKTSSVALLKPQNANKSPLKTSRQSLIPNPAPAPPLINVDFQFEHSFPSGILNLYLENKLIYQTELHGEKKKIFLFNNYKGKVNGTFQLPAGISILQIHLVCKQLGISTVKEMKVDVHEGEHPVLRIRYQKATKELEAKWI